MSEINRTIRQQRINEGRELPQNSSKVPMPKVLPPKAETGKKAISKQVRGSEKHG